MFQCLSGMFVSRLMILFVVVRCGSAVSVRSLFVKFCRSLM
jgi:hypothetical protein